MSGLQSGGFSRAYLTLIGVSLLGTILLLALGYVPTTRLAGGASVLSMVAGCGVSWIASCGGALPVARAIASKPSQAAQSILIATAVRFLVVLLLVVPFVFSGLVERNVFVVWVAVSYLLLLAIETPLAVRLVRLAGEKNA